MVLSGPHKYSYEDLMVNAKMIFGDLITILKIRRC